MNLLFNTIDNKFVQELIDLYTLEHNIKVDLYPQTNENERKQFVEWADIIFCEWSENNALWYSNHKKPNQKLIIRLHRYELFSFCFMNINWTNVDHLIFISPEIKRLANQLLLNKQFIINESNFDFEYYYAANKRHLKSDMLYDKNSLWDHWTNHGSKMVWDKPLVKLIDVNYDDICDDLKHLNGGTVIWNYVKSTMFNNIPKQQGSEFNIALIGMLPRLKRPDIAIDIIEHLASINPNFKLHIIGKDYTEWFVTRDSETETQYYKDLYNRINLSPFRNNIIFEGYHTNPEILLQNIGYTLSLSDIEGSHQAVAESMATGCIPFIYGDALKRYKLDQIYPKQYCYYDNNINYLCNQIILYATNNYLRNHESQRCREYIYNNFRLSLIKQKFDELLLN